MAELPDPKRLIEQAICQHMPSAAVASGWMSKLNPSDWIKEVSEKFPFAERTTELGLTRLTAWLKERGVEAGESYIKALRIEWLKELMRSECQ